MLGEALPRAGKACAALASVSWAARPHRSPAHLAQEEPLWAWPLPFPLLSSHLSGCPPCYCMLPTVHSGEVFSQEPSLPRAQGEPGIPR